MIIFKIIKGVKKLRVSEEIYSLNAPELAPKLLGMKLCRRMDDNNIIKLKITETEAYFGEQDTACHAHKGRTKRTETLYNPGGIAYVYLCYGIHYLLNVVSRQKDFPQAVLIRGLENFNGPGKLTKALNINKEFNGENLMSSERLWIEPADSPIEFQTAKRVGIDYATEEYRNKLWRFILKI